MEIFMLSFAAGVVACMIVVALAQKFTPTFFALALVGLLGGLWYLWGAYGALYVAEHWAEPSTFQSGLEQQKSGGAPTKLETLGQAGDLFGGINALFAIFAFGGVVFAAVLQGRALEIAGKQQLQQSFEPLFFHLLELHRKVSVTQLRLSGRTGKPKVAVSSTDTLVDFPRAIRLLRRNIRMKAIGLLKERAGDKEKLENEVSRIYAYFYEFNQDELGPHFRSLYQVFKLIDESAFDQESKVKYANIARSTLGRDQLFLLAVNCAASYGEEFRPLVERYGLLKHVDRRPALLNIDERIAHWCYSPTATMDASERGRYWKYKPTSR